MLKVDSISFQYTKNKPVLQDFSFTLQKGEHLCVMGESGCGKSTLLKVIYGLLDLNEGIIFWNDEQVLGPAFHLVPGFENFKYVAQVLSILSRNSFKLNPAKCNIFQNQIHYLSHIISAILQLHELKTLTEANKFLAALSQYRNCIPRCITMATSVHQMIDLTKPNESKPI